VRKVAINPERREWSTLLIPPEYMGPGGDGLLIGVIRNGTSIGETIVKGTEWTREGGRDGGCGRGKKAGDPWA